MKNQWVGLVGGILVFLWGGAEAVTDSASSVMNLPQAVTATDLDDPFEVLRRERECSYDILCGTARRAAEQRALSENSASRVYRASCKIKQSGSAPVHGELRVYGRVKGGEADVAQWLSLGFVGHQWPAATRLKGEADADFRWYGQWDGPRDWPNLTVYPSGDGVLRTPLIDERELDMIATADRVTARTKVRGRNVVYQYQIRDFAKVFDLCRRKMVWRMGNQLVSDLKALPSTCTQGECVQPE